ncbi:molybdopterin cofactor-binding domain-containing protein [Candidatus Palauibacter sp.]|uniref:molybdopterin cofactor-binding domain-containing protein n=1 Tax=Candidatus Palauibacter sp. TaxID=3101350 RepID=UPI003B01E5D9
MSRAGGTWVGARVPRNEDARLLTGRAQFVEDVEPPGTLHVAFVRSDLPAGRLRSLDVEGARAHPGVHAVFTAADLGPLLRPGAVLVPPPPLEGLVFHARTALPLVRDRIRHQGEALAMIVADSRYVAEDAAALVEADIEPLDAVVDLGRALNWDAPRIHEDLPSNLAARVRQSKGDYAAARARADLVIERRLSYDRGIGGAIENRSVVADWDARADRLQVWDTTQAPIPVRNVVAAALGLSESQVRFIAPFVGGGFGPKIMFYAEEILVPWASMQLGRPVKWVEDRYENFFATTQERGQLHEAEIAVTREGRILGVRDIFIHDSGAYDPYGLTIPINTQCTLLGPYRVPNYESEFRVAFTNKPIVTPVRGAGRQHGVFVMERLLDLAARGLGLDPVEIRRRNVIGSDEFPYNHEIMYQDFAPLRYDSGSYEESLEEAVRLIDYERTFPRERERVRADGRAVGIGVVNYVEGTGIGPYEGARITVEPSGTVRLATGVGTQGQGHFTAFAQIVADAIGVKPSDVRVVTGDTSDFHWGTGTFASRGAVVAGNAIHAAAQSVREKILRHAAEALEVDPDDLELVDGAARVKGAPDLSVDLGTLALAANPLRGAVEPGTEPGLEATSYFGPPYGTTANGTHALVVAVDPETAMVEILRYLVVHDCGTVINPTIVEGQIHGGVAAGIGNAFYEELVFDEFGGTTNASFMDYLLPTATDVPPIETAHLETPSTLNPLGTKGVGEGGAIPVAAAFAQAVEDALADIAPGLEILDIPTSPARLFELLRNLGEGSGRNGGPS